MKLKIEMPLITDRHFPGKMPKKRRVPEVLWRLFRHRARTLAETIVSLLPPTPPSAEECRCKGLHCLGCSKDAMSFLLRPEDPSDYRKLLAQCYIVVSDNAPPLSPFLPHYRWSQYLIVERTIQMMSQRRPASYNVLCSGYKKSCTSPALELLSCSSWNLLLSRVGDDLMVYLLRHTSIFLSLPQKKYQQVAGFPISDMCFKTLKCSSKSEDQHPLLVECGARNKRKRTEDVDSTEGKKKCHFSNSVNGPAGSLDSTGVKCSTSLISHHESRDYVMKSFSDAPKSTSGTGTIKSKAASEQCLTSITARLGKRSRPFRWQRHKKKRQLICEVNCGNIHCDMFPSNSIFPPETFPCNKTSSSNQEKVQMPWQCSCCLILQSVSPVPKRTEINRQSIFYNQEPSLSVLPKKHILHSLKPNLADSTYLIGNIFGLSEVNAGAQSIPCFYKSRSCLTGSACLYHSLAKWLKRLIRRTQWCHYTKFLDKHCAVPSCDQYGSVSEETRVQRTSHGSDPKQCADTVETIYSQYEAVKSCCNSSQIVSYIWAVSRSVLPQELLGTPSNWRIMKRNVLKFINLRRYEKFPLKLCMHGLKTSRFPFLSNKYFLNSQHARGFKYIEGQNEGLHKKFSSWNGAVHVTKHKLLERWIFWYFSFLVVPLVQANFYVTESEHGKQNVYYYRKSVWEKFTNSTSASLKDQRYSYLDIAAVKNIIGNRKFGYSNLRLRPKGNGVRMVANLTRSSRLPVNLFPMEARSSKMQGKANHQNIKFDYYQSVNSVLRDPHTILKDIQLNEPEKLGSSVFDYNDVYKKLCPFLVGQKKGSTSVPSLFIVVSDVLKAFDSVDQEKLLTILKDILLKDKYILKQYEQVVCTKKSLWVHKQRMVIDDDIHTGSTRFTSSSTLRSLHTVFVNREHVEHVKKEVLLSNIKEHVKYNILQLDRKFYLQGVGIPQGGVLSPLLSSLYYGHMDMHMIYPFLEKALKSGSSNENHAMHISNDDQVSSTSYMLLRFVDDILFISTSKKQATDFLSRLQRGFRDYNCNMNENKFGVNFDVGQTLGLPSSRVYVGDDGISFLRWSGLLINCCTLEVQADYTKYWNIHLSSTLTICWQGKPEHRLKDKLCGFLRPKCHCIFFDSNINSEAVVRLNIYQVFLLSAMKLHCYIRGLSFICKIHIRSCLDSIKRSLSYMYALIKKRMHSKHFGSDFKPVLKLEKGEVEWLGLHAYIEVLKRKQTCYKEILALLRSRLHSHIISGNVSPELKYAVDASHSSLLWKIKY